MIWERIQYVGKGTDEADPLSGTYYICESCDRQISESSKNQMVRLGQWQATAVAKDPKHIGFHLNRLYSPWVSWVDMALNFEAAKGDHQKMQVFVNASLGLPFERVAGEKLDWERLRDRALNSNYSQGAIPEGGVILTAGVDVQGDRLEVVIVAWGRGEESWVIAYEKILGDPLQPAPWEQLVHVTSKSYLNSAGAELKVRATCIDSGYLTQEVYHQVRKFRHLHWFAIKGQSGDKPLVSRPSFQEINYKGDRLKKGIQLYKVRVDLAKETLYSRTSIETPGAKYINFPSDLDSEWYEGFCSEVQVTKHKNGKPYLVWEKLAGVRNEPLDVFVYALAAAQLVGISRIAWGKEEKKLNQQLSIDENCCNLPKPKAIAKKSPKVRRKKGNSLIDRY